MVNVMILLTDRQTDGRTLNRQTDKGNNTI